MNLILSFNCSWTFSPFKFTSEEVISWYGAVVIYQYMKQFYWYIEKYTYLILDPFQGVKKISIKYMKTKNLKSIYTTARCGN